MKKPHNMKPGELKNFKNLGELNEFAENHIYDVKEFKLKSNSEVDKYSIISICFFINNIIKQ